MRTLAFVLVAVALSLCCFAQTKRSDTPGQAPSVEAQSADGAVGHIVSSDKFKDATTFIESDQPRFVRELISLTEIPAPPFKEQKRAAAYLEMLRASGLADVEMDAEGNVMGVRKGSGGPMPALNLALIRAMSAAKIQTASDILFVGNVGEEGEGDLRGARYLLQKGKYRDQIKQFISIDGGNQDLITNGALGSKRYRVTFKGPGGHSYGAFGMVSPAFAMANAMAKFSRISVPAKPKTTFNVGVVGGGTSVNSIPSQVFMVVDMRSEAPVELNTLVESFLGIIRQAVEEENQTRSTANGKIEADVELIGDRPAGETAVTSSLVQTTTAAVKAFGLAPRYGIESTDSNIPISMGVPAVTVGHGPSGLPNRSHSLDEWTDVETRSSLTSAQVMLAIILAAAGNDNQSSVKPLN